MVLVLIGLGLAVSGLGLGLELCGLVNITGILQLHMVTLPVLEHVQLSLICMHDGRTDGQTDRQT